MQASYIIITVVRQKDTSKTTNCVGVQYAAKLVISKKPYEAMPLSLMQVNLNNLMQVNLKLRAPDSVMHLRRTRLIIWILKLLLAHYSRFSLI